MRTGKKIGRRAGILAMENGWAEQRKEEMKRESKRRVEGGAAAGKATK